MLEEIPAFTQGQKGMSVQQQVIHLCVFGAPLFNWHYESTHIETLDCEEGRFQWFIHFRIEGLDHMIN